MAPKTGSGVSAAATAGMAARVAPAPAVRALVGTPRIIVHRSVRAFHLVRLLTRSELNQAVQKPREYLHVPIAILFRLLPVVAERIILQCRRNRRDAR